MLEHVINEFLPIQLSISPETLSQIYDNTIRYFNTHSAVKIMEMFDTVSGSAKVELTTSYSVVSQVYPSAIQGDILTQHPWQMLLNMTLLDNMTSDLAQISHAYQEYRVYLGRDFHWIFVESYDPTVAPYLLLENLPHGASKICVIGARKINPNEDVKGEFVLDWMLKYMLALVKIAEGRILRKAALIDIVTDGKELVSEGREEKKELEENLGIEGRYLCFAQRI